MRGRRVVAICDRIPVLAERARATPSRADGKATYSAYEDVLGDVLADGNVEAIALTVRRREQGRYGGRVDAWREQVASGRPGQITLGEGQYLYGVSANAGRGGV
jgi:hypothetical protein